MIANTSFIVRGIYSLTDNPIVKNIQTDSSGKNISRYQNVYGKLTSNYSSSFLYSKKFNPLNLSLSLDGELNQRSQLSYSNNLENRTLTNTYELGLGFSRFVSGKYDVSLNFKEFYNKSKFSLQPEDPVNYWSSNARFYLEIYPTRRFLIHTECLYNFQQRSRAFTNSLHQYIVNAWVGEKMLPGENLTVKISVNDLFDQNLGFSRTSQNNILSQNIQTTIRRYFMLSLIWNFIKTGNSQNKP